MEEQSNKHGMFISTNSKRIKKAWKALTKGNEKWKLAVTSQYDGCRYTMRIQYNNINSLGFDVNPMPHCCGMGIVSGMYTYDERLSLEDLVHLAEAIGRDNDWTQLVYTTNHEQYHIAETLAKCKWTKVKQFTSMSTGNNITVWAKRILTRMIY